MASGASTMVAAGKPAACNLGGDPTSTSFVCDSHNTCALASSSSALSLHSHSFYRPYSSKHTFIQCLSPAFISAWWSD